MRSSLLERKRRGKRDREALCATDGRAALINCIINIRARRVGPASAKYCLSVNRGQSAIRINRLNRTVRCMFYRRWSRSIRPLLPHLLDGLSCFFNREMCLTEVFLSLPPPLLAAVLLSGDRDTIEASRRCSRSLLFVFLLSVFVGETTRTLPAG